MANQGYYHFLLGLLFALFLIQPFTGDRFLGQSLSDLNTFVILGASALAVGSKRWRTWVALAIALPAAVFVAIGGGGDQLTDTTKISIGLVYYAFIGGCLAHDLFKQRKVNAGTVSLALCLYLIFAVTFGYLYSLLHLLNPASFRGVPVEEMGVVADAGEFFYFSLVTLTTLGYGDIVPATQTAQTYTTFEAVVGQLFLVVVVARLVAMEIANNRDD